LVKGLKNSETVVDKLPINRNETVAWQIGI
jgi:hypothetical protein